jgi:hypothetical protein
MYYADVDCPHSACISPNCNVLQSDAVLVGPADDLTYVNYNDSDNNLRQRPTSEGLKFDSDKPRWDLLPLKPIEDIVKVLSFGAKKYGPDNWRVVANAKERYFAALMRHIVAYRNGEGTDPESGLSHIAHALCNLTFLYELEGSNDKE